MAKRKPEEDISEDLYCEVLPCKRQRAPTSCFTCIGCTIQLEAHSKASYKSCCSGGGMNWTATRIHEFHRHLDQHAERGDWIPPEYYLLEAK